MKNNVLWMLSLLLFNAAVLSAQTTVPDKSPEFPGGQNVLMQYLAKNISYPAAARNAKAEGTVIVKFIVEADGRISNISALNQGPLLHGDLIKEALRVVKLMPKWMPGEKDGKPAASEMVVPIKFKLQ